MHSLTVVWTAPHIGAQGFQRHDAQRFLVDALGQTHARLAVVVIDCDLPQVVGGHPHSAGQIGALSRLKEEGV